MSDETGRMIDRRAFLASSVAALGLGAITRDWTQEQRGRPPIRLTAEKDALGLKVTHVTVDGVKIEHAWHADEIDGIVDSWILDARNLRQLRGLDTEVFDTQEHLTMRTRGYVVIHFQEKA